ncbi:MAG: hypothetical protein NC086_05625 [Alistipes sp.]|nr:hypothetical protein [Alistipes sp.]
MRKRRNYFILVLMMVWITGCSVYPSPNDEMPSRTEEDPAIKLYTAESYESWEEAYENVIRNAEDFASLVLYLGLHDFDDNGVPELVLSDKITIGVYTFEDYHVKRIADLYVQEQPWGVNGCHYVNNCVYFQQDGSDGSSYLCWTIYDGESVTGFYDDYQPERYILNENEVSQEDFERVFKISEMKDYQRNKLWYFGLDKEKGTLRVLFDTNQWKADEIIDIKTILKEDFDMKYDDEMSSRIREELAEKLYTTVTYESWEKAYENVIRNAEDFLWDLSDPYKIGNPDTDSASLALYLGLYDFDDNGVPELVLSDKMAIGVYTFEDNRVKRIAEEQTWGIDRCHYANNCIYFQQTGPDGNNYRCWTIYDGEYVTGFYDDYEPKRYVLNKKEVSKEDFERVFNMSEMKDYQQNELGEFEPDKEKGTLRVLFDTDQWRADEVIDVGMILNEDFDMLMR